MSSHKEFATVPDGVVGVDPNHPLTRPLAILDAEAGLVERTRDKVAFVGYATSSRDLAPFNDPEYDIVGLNQLYRFIPRSDAWFDIHLNWEEDNVDGTDHRAWLAACGIPIFMAEPDKDLPTAVRYPLQACMTLGADYFTSTISYMIAWGIHQGYKRIELYGIDLIVGTEYEVQKSAVEFWLGIAHGRGIEIKLPVACALLKATHRYGYQKEPDWHPVRQSDFAARIATLTKERDQLISRLHALDGAIHEVVKRADWAADPSAREQWLQDQHRQAIATLSTIDGALQEASHWSELALLRARGADIRLHG